MSIQRKIYETFFGQIPRDEDGRTYEIHHIDGNRKNNSIFNLVALTIKDHYETHYLQGDYAACIRIISRMKKSQKEISEFASKMNHRRAKEGNHPFLGGKIQGETSRKRVKNGTHNRLDGKSQSKKARNASLKRVANKTHHFLGGSIQRKYQLKKIANGEHLFLNSEFQRNKANRMLKEGTHPWLSINKKTETCPHCKKIGNGGVMYRWHFNNCRDKL